MPAAISAGGRTGDGSPLCTALDQPDRCEGAASPGTRRIFHRSLGSGIEFAAYEFLERFCGIRWLRPGPNGTRIPKRRTISLEAVDIEQAPSFQYRSYSYWYEGKTTRILGTPYWKKRSRREYALLHDWMKHNKMNDCRVVPDGHAFYRQIVPKTEYARHPEYFALVKGSRKPGGTHHTGWQLCTTNPVVIERAVQYVEKRFRAGQFQVSISPNDGLGFCECDCCRALDDPKLKDDRGRPVISDRIATFVNTVARRVRAEFPHQYVGYSGYSLYSEPPWHVKLESNVMVWLNNRQYYNWIPGYRERFYRFYDNWRTMQPHVFVLSSEYLTHQFRWGTPWSILPLDAEVINWAAGQKTFTTRSGPTPIQNDWSSNGISYYATARLLSQTEAAIDQARGQSAGTRRPERGGSAGRKPPTSPSAAARPAQTSAERADAPPKRPGVRSA